MNENYLEMIGELIGIRGVENKALKSNASLNKTHHHKIKHIVEIR